MSQKSEDELKQFAYPSFQHFQANGLTKRELSAIENHAQLLRFVVREQMTSEQAARLAINHADALFEELKEKDHGNS